MNKLHLSRHSIGSQPPIRWLIPVASTAVIARVVWGWNARSPASAIRRGLGNHGEPFVLSATRSFEQVIQEARHDAV